MKLFNKIVVGVAVVLLNTFNASAQCKRYTKKYCIPALAPYMHNGQLTSAYMVPGDSADVLMTFNAGKQYRILVGSQDMIGKVQFKVKDRKGKVLYASDEEATNPYWDFTLENTQQFFIQIKIPEKKTITQMTKMVAEGCVSLLVGFKE